MERKIKKTYLSSRHVASRAPYTPAVATSSLSVGCRGSGSVLAALGGNGDAGGDVEGRRHRYVSVSNH